MRRLIERLDISGTRRLENFRADGLTVDIAQVPGSSRVTRLNTGRGTEYWLMQGEWPYRFDSRGVPSDGRLIVQQGRVVRKQAVIRSYGHSIEEVSIRR